jgi:hypothetical protein
MPREVENSVILSQVAVMEYFCNMHSILQRYDPTLNEDRVDAT